jgi:alanine transaminase
MSSIKLENLNPRHLKVEYAVRGELAIKAEEYRIKLKQPNHGLPFDKVVSTNIGNPQQKGLDQKPLTFVRQVSLTVTRFTLSQSLSPLLGGCIDGAP